MNLNEAERGMLQHPSFSSMLAQLLIFELIREKAIAFNGF